MRLERYGAVTVLPVMAAPAEYGEHLRARIDPLMTGIGPVEGAVALAAALARLEAKVAMEELLAMMGDFAVDEAGLQRMHSPQVRGFTHVPVTFTA